MASTEENEKSTSSLVYFFLSQVTFDEVTFFMESRGIDLQSRFHGYARQEIDTFGDYLSTVTVVFNFY